MSGFGAVLLWIAEAIGKKRLGDAFESGAKQEIRMLRRALLESQQHRDEYDGMEGLLDRTMVQRDALQLENIRLRLENRDLRAELAALKLAS